MDNFKVDSNNVIKKIYNQDSLLDILIEFEGVLDANDLYVFENWINGEIVEGPKLGRYWIEVTLKYPYEKMPNPTGGLRLIKQGARITFCQKTQSVPVSLKDIADGEISTAYDSGKRKKKEEKIWLVVIKMPRRFIEDIDTGLLSVDDDEDEFIDLDVVQDAEEQGLDDETILNNQDEENQVEDQNEF